MMKIASLFCLGALLSTAPALAVPTIAAHTAVVVFNARSMHVTAKQSGHCWTSSIASQRSDAYRCMAGNGIHDPCFTLSPREVACPTGIAADRGIAITLTKPLPQSNQARSVFQMQLQSGAQCNRGTGTVIPGYPFYCAGGLVCSAPPGEPQGAVFVHCGTPANGKVAGAGSYLVRVLYE
ncbi:MAG TPA: hypothetical protein VFN37_04295 [Candidatus Baltobacteraceae bacterium]|nr:hypothetical protein [Candidatus Baltobacteraceae bacterium]